MKTLTALIILLFAVKVGAQMIHGAPAFTQTSFEIPPIAVGDTVMVKTSAYFDGGKYKLYLPVQFRRQPDIWVVPERLNLNTSPTEITIYIAPQAPTCYYPYFVNFYVPDSDVIIQPSIPSWIVANAYDPNVKSETHVYDSSMRFFSASGDTVWSSIPVAMGSGRPWPLSIKNVKPPFLGITSFYPVMCPPPKRQIAFAPTSIGTFIDTAWLVDMHTSPPDSIRMILIGTTTSAAVADRREERITFYPNPVRDNLIMRIPAGTRIEELMVVDLMCRSVPVKADLNNGVIDCHLIPPGNYFMLLRTAEGRRLIRSFVRLPN